MAHRPARRAVEPLVKLPILVVFTPFVHLSELNQGALRTLGFTRLNQGCHIESTKKRPRSTIVVLVRVVQVVHPVVLPPVSVGRRHRRPARFDWPRLVES